MKECLMCKAPLRNEIRLSEIIRATPLINDPICQGCSNDFLDLADIPTCLGCGRKQTEGMSQPCHDCLRWQQSYAFDFSNRALYEYNQQMKDFMKQYKFNGDYYLRKVFSGQIHQQLKKCPDVIVPIPVGRDTMLTRGFNQVTGLLELVNYSNILKVKAKRKAVRQSEKNRRQRIELIQPFELIQSQKYLIENQSILLVDDVYTTGTTIRHAASLLYHAGATSVRGLTLAR